MRQLSAERHANISLSICFAIRHRSWDWHFLHSNKGVSNCLTFSKLATYHLYLCSVLPSEGLYHLQFCFGPTENQQRDFNTPWVRMLASRALEREPPKSLLMCPLTQQNSKLAILVPSKRTDHPKRLTRIILNAWELRLLQASQSKTCRGATVISLK